NSQNILSRGHRLDSDFFPLLHRRLGFRGQVLVASSAHALRPDVEAAVQAHAERSHLAGNLPGAPDALSFVVALVEDVVLTDVLLGPVALAVRDVVTPIDEKLADPVAPFALHAAAGEDEAKVHHVLAGD